MEANVVLGGVGALVGALVGAAVWAAIGFFTGYEVGFIAIGVGALAGIGATAAVGGKKSSALGVIAAVCALLGILAGKYAAVHFSLSDYLASPEGQAEIAAAEAEGYEIDRGAMAMEGFKTSFAFFDALWALFAVGAAWHFAGREAE